MAKCVLVKTKIELYNKKPYIVHNDINVECIACSIEKRGKHTKCHVRIRCVT